MDNLKILVVGATGKQGRAVISALATFRSQSSRSQPRSIEILGLTRNAQSSHALALKLDNDITLVEGDVRNPQEILASYENITSVFLITVPPSDEAQALPFIDASIASGVRHIVFSSVDRGGEVTSWETPTSVSHFIAKHNIELYLREKTLHSQTDWTILRPAGFMEIYSPGAFGKMMAGLWATMPRDIKMQLVSVDDIGLFAGKVLLEGPERWMGKTVGLAGDELTFTEANHIFRSTVGYDMPRTWDIVSRAVRWAFDDANKSMNWFEEFGFKVDIATLRRYNQVRNFESWLKECSPWIRQASNAQ